MTKESLEKIKSTIIHEIDKLDINIIDKGEALINIPKMLDNYDENIKILRKENNNGRTRKN